MRKKVLCIDKAWCKGCGICAAFCPSHVLSIVDGKVQATSPARCVYCGQCELCCPDYAIYVEQEAVEVPQWVKGS